MGGPKSTRRPRRRPLGGAGVLLQQPVLLPAAVVVLLPMAGAAKGEAALAARGGVPWLPVLLGRASTQVLPEFVVWSERPAGTWHPLHRFFVGEMLAMGPDDL